MLAILSPAKTMKFDFKNKAVKSTKPPFQKEANELVAELKKYDIPQLMDLMSISKNLAQLNVERFNRYMGKSASNESAAAIFAYRGDVYQGLEGTTLSAEALKKANDHLRILSGLYGLIRPTDEIKPYRLEMGIPLEVGKHNNLYEFWGDKITLELHRSLEKANGKYIVNLASKEYSKAIDQDHFKGKWIEVDFREMRKGNLRFISFNAKKARGMMARYIIENGMKDPDHLRGFNGGGYLFDEKGSEENQLLFVKPE